MELHCLRLMAFEWSLCVIVIVLNCDSFAIPHPRFQLQCKEQEQEFSSAIRSNDIVIADWQHKVESFNLSICGSVHYFRQNASGTANFEMHTQAPIIMSCGWLFKPSNYTFKLCTSRLQVKVYLLSIARMHKLEQISVPLFSWDYMATLLARSCTDVCRISGQLNAICCPISLANCAQSVKCPTMVNIVFCLHCAATDVRKD